MEDLTQIFEERLQEIEAYLQFLEAIESEARSGPPRLGNEGAHITTQQQRILYSGVFLQLYNLVEATIVRCLDNVTYAALEGGLWLPKDLTESLRKEWVRVIAKTHKDLSFENRLLCALNLCGHLLDSLPVAGFRVEKGGGGNWDDTTIEQIVERLGFKLSVQKDTLAMVKRRTRDDLGALGLVKKLRNHLAHGSISFAECGSNIAVSELRNLADSVAAYMREVVASFTDYIGSYGFLAPAKRPLYISQ